MTTQTPQREKDTVTTRKAYKHQKMAEVARWRADITHMENQLLKAEGAKVKHEDELAQLKAQLREAEKRLGDFDEGLDETWHDLTTYIDKGWHHMSASFADLQAKLAKEMARKGVNDVTNR